MYLQGVGAEHHSGRYDVRMWYVYLLQSKKNESTYVGFSSDLRSRVREHNRGGVTATRKGCPWRLIYYEAYESEKLARTRERLLKQRGQAVREMKKRAGIVPRMVLGDSMPIEE